MKYTPSRAALGVVACSAIVVAGLVTVTPAGAALTQEAQAVATVKWGKIWKKKLQPKADQRYYSKTLADSRYTTKVEADAKYYSKTDSDAKYYSKTDSDAKFQHKQKVYRGTFLVGAPTTAAGAFVFGDLSFGVTLAASPTAHYIQTGGLVPAGCSGSATAPNADPGHLCVFESQAFNVGATRFVTDLSFSPDTATPAGAWLYGTSVGASYGFFGGSWAMQPGGGALVTSPKSPPFGPTSGMPE